MTKRVTLQDAKEIWFYGDLTLHLTQIDGTIFALPKVEAERALKYCQLLEKCKTYQEAQSLYEKFSSDPNRPKLIPRLLDLQRETDTFEEMWVAEDASGVRDFGELSDLELLNYWLPKTFNLWQRDEPNIYMAEGVLTLVRDFQVWTDQWMPIEVAQSLGVLDEGFGVDYVNAEYLYQELAKFIEVFGKAGIESKVDEPSFLKLLGYV